MWWRDSEWCCCLGFIVFNRCYCCFFSLSYLLLLQFCVILFTVAVFVVYVFVVFAYHLFTTRLNLTATASPISVDYNGHTYSPTIQVNLLLFDTTADKFNQCHGVQEKNKPTTKTQNKQQNIIIKDAKGHCFKDKYFP